MLVVKDLIIKRKKKKTEEMQMNKISEQNVEQKRKK